MSLKNKFITLLLLAMIIFVVRAYFANTLEGQYSGFMREIQKYNNIREKIAFIGREIGGIEGFVVQNEISDPLLENERVLFIAKEIQKISNQFSLNVKSISYDSDEKNLISEPTLVQSLNSSYRNLIAEISNSENISFLKNHNKIQQTITIFKYFLWSSSIVLILLSIGLFCSFYLPMRQFFKTYTLGGKVKSMSCEIRELVSFVNSLSQNTQAMSRKIDSQAKELNKRIYLNDLTGLPNRNQLLMDLEKAEKIKVVALLNIDEFHFINDNYGDMFGDYVLKVIAKKIGQMVEEPHILYKLHSDEFAIGCASSDFLECWNISPMIQKIINEIEKESIVFNQSKTNISLTAGVGENLQKADMALKYAKRLRQDIICFEEHGELKKFYSETIFWKNKLKEDIEKNRLVPFFQPIVNLENGVLEGYEALARIVEDDGTVASPLPFLEVAKKSRLYGSITRKMFVQVIKEIEKLECKISINISFEDILNPVTVNAIFRALEHSSAGDRLIFEITETDKIHSYKVVNEFIANIKNKFGCKFAIDDFGNGFSNFDYLLKFDIDYVKIDGELIKNFIHNDRKTIFIKHIASLSRSLGIKVVAEYIEDKEMADAVRSMGIELGQGFYFSQAVPAEQLSNLPLCFNGEENEEYGIS